MHYSYRLLLIALFILAACSPKPSETEIEQALAPRISIPSCITSTLFRQFPVTLSTSFISPAPQQGNAPVFDLFVKIGFLTKSGLTYSLTPDGQAAYNTKIQGFCYSAGYEIAKIRDISDDTDKLGPATDKGWLVTLDLKQKTIASWAKAPELAKFTFDKSVLSEEAKLYHIQFLREKGETEIKLVDFDPPHGFAINEGF